jgi:hypothetical protein
MNGHGFRCTVTCTGDRCYDHIFLRFLPIFVEKNGMLLKNQCYEHIFEKKLAVLWAKKPPIFLPNFSAKIFFFYHNIGPRAVCSWQVVGFFAATKKRAFRYSTDPKISFTQWTPLSVLTLDMHDSGSRDFCSNPTRQSSDQCIYSICGSCFIIVAILHLF